MALSFDDVKRVHCAAPTNIKLFLCAIDSDAWLALDLHFTRDVSATMSAATRRLPGLAQRQLTRSTNPHFSCVAPRLAPRVAPPSAARIQYRYVTTTVPSDKPSVPNPTDPSSPEPEVSQGTAAPASEKLKEGASQDPELYVRPTTITSCRS